MNKLTKILLVIITLAVVYSTVSDIYSDTSGRDNFLNATNPSQQKEPDLIIKGIHLTETKGMNLTSEIQADSGFIYQQKEYAEFDKVTFCFYEKNQPMLRVRADNAVLNMSNRDITAEGKVVVSAQNDLKLETETLSWQTGKQILFTDKPVKITNPQTKIKGHGLKADMKLERVKITDSVTCVIN